MMLPARAVDRLLQEHFDRAAADDARLLEQVRAHAANGLRIDAPGLEGKLAALAARANEPAKVRRPSYRPPAPLSSNTREEASQNRPKKRKRERPPASPVVLDCALLCIDAAGTSGFAAWDRGVVRWFGEVDVFGSEPARVLERFLTLPGPHVLVCERPFVPRKGQNTVTSRPVGERIWRELAKRYGFGARVVRVYPSQWRAVALGKGWGCRKRDETRERERELAAALVREQFGRDAPDVGGDAAPAVMLGRWASYAGEVLAVLPKRRKAAR